MRSTRSLLYLRIFPGSEAEYDRRHVSIWPELASEIRRSGFRNMTGFRRGTDVWYYQEAYPDSATVFGIHNAKAVNRRWDHDFRDVIAEQSTPAGTAIWYNEIFHLDGARNTGPSERGLFGIVINPDRGPECDSLHAAVPSDLQHALVAAGFCNFSGFRREAHVVYYGEFYPQMKVAFGALARTEALAECLAKLEGLATTLTEGGDLITAREVFHQD